MKVIANIFIEGPSNKLLVRYDESGLKLPSIIITNDYLIKDHLTTMLIGIGISDVVEDDIVLYNFDDTMENGEHIIYATFKVRTRIGSVQDAFNCKFLTLGSLKDSLDKFALQYDSFVTRLYILNPYS